MDACDDKDNESTDTDTAEDAAISPSITAQTARARDTEETQRIQQLRDEIEAEADRHKLPDERQSDEHWICRTDHADKEASLRGNIARLKRVCPRHQSPESHRRVLTAPSLSRL